MIKSMRRLAAYFYWQQGNIHLLHHLDSVKLKLPSYLKHHEDRTFIYSRLTNSFISDTGSVLLRPYHVDKWRIKFIQ